MIEKDFCQIIKFCSENTQKENIEIEKFSDEIAFLQRTYYSYQKECEYFKLYSRADTEKLFMFLGKINHFMEEHNENFSLIKNDLIVHGTLIHDLIFFLLPKLSLNKIDITRLIVFKKI